MRRYSRSACSSCSWCGDDDVMEGGIGYLHIHTLDGRSTDIQSNDFKERSFVSRSNVSTSEEELQVEIEVDRLQRVTEDSTSEESQSLDVTSLRAFPLAKYNDDWDHDHDCANISDSVTGMILLKIFIALINIITLTVTPTRKRDREKRESWEIVTRKDEQTHGRTDGQIDRQTNRPSDLPTNIEIPTDRHIKKRQTLGRSVDRHTRGWTNRQVGRLIVWPKDYNRQTD